MDGDGDRDILTSDRKGPMRGCRWLENPGPDDPKKSPWKNHFIGCRDKEVLFLTVVDIDEDGFQDVLVAAKSSKRSQVVLLRRLDSAGDAWKEYVIPYPQQTGSAKAVVVGDIDHDGDLDIITCEERENKMGLGLFWYENPLSSRKND